MYKLKLGFLLDTRLGKMWFHHWVDWDGIDEVDGILEHNLEHATDYVSTKYGTSAQYTVVHVVVLETRSVDEGQLQCVGCKCHFDKPEDKKCPYCESINWAFGSVVEDKPETIK